MQPIESVDPGGPLCDVLCIPLHVRDHAKQSIVMRTVKLLPSSVSILPGAVLLCHCWTRVSRVISYAFLSYGGERDSSSSSFGGAFAVNLAPTDGLPLYVCCNSSSVYGVRVGRWRQREHTFSIVLTCWPGSRRSNVIAAHTAICTSAVAVRWQESSKPTISTRRRRSSAVAKDGREDERSGIAGPNLASPPESLCRYFAGKIIIGGRHNVAVRLSRSSVRSIATHSFSAVRRDR